MKKENINQIVRKSGTLVKYDPHKKKGLILRGLREAASEKTILLVGESGEKIKTSLHRLPEFAFIQSTSINEAFDYLTSRDISLVLYDIMPHQYLQDLFPFILASKELYPSLPVISYSLTESNVFEDRSIEIDKTIEQDEVRILNIYPCSATSEKAEFDDKNAVGSHEPLSSKSIEVTNFVISKQSETDLEFIERTKFYLYSGVSTAIINLQINTSDIVTLLNLSHAYFRLKRYEESIKTYNRIIRIYPNSSEAYYGLAACYNVLNMIDEAIKACSEAIRIKPDFLKPYFLLGYMYEQRAFDRRRETINDFYKKDMPDEAKKALSQIDIFKGAIEAYNMVLKLRPDNAHAHLSLGHIFGRVGRYQEAINYFNESIKNRTECDSNDFIYEALGNAYEKAGQLKEALDAYKRIRFNPDLMDATKKAVEEMKVSLMESFEAQMYADAFFRLGNIYRQMNLHHEAIDSFKKTIFIIRIKPEMAGDFKNAYFLIGEAYFRLCLYQEAIEFFKEAAKVTPNLAEVYFNIGCAYVGLNNYREAILFFRHSIKIKRDYAKAYFNMGHCYLQIGQRSYAVKAYQILQKLQSNLAEKLFDEIYK